MKNKDKIWDSWNRLIEGSDNIWIYGAGVVAERLFEVFRYQNREDYVQGFVVTKRKTEEYELCKKRVLVLEELINQSNKDITFLVAVSDAYQNEIFSLLKSKGFMSVMNAYPYSFLLEAEMPKNAFKPIPQVIEIDLRELMIQQFNDNVFLRYDVIENILEVEKGNLIKDEKNYENIIFKVDSQLRILESTEELVHVLCKNIQKVKIHRINEQCIKDRKCSKNNSVNNFQIEKKFKQLYMNWLVPFVGIIWPSAEFFFEAIVDDLKREREVELVCFKDFFFNKKEFRAFMYAIYATDDAEKWQIDKKLDAIGEKKKYVVRVVQFYLVNPRFEIKHQGHTISKAATRLKTDIRKRYKEYTPGYIYDIIFHVADNYEQSDEIRRLLS